MKKTAGDTGLDISPGSPLFDQHHVVCGNYQSCPSAPNRPALCHPLEGGFGEIGDVGGVGNIVPGLKRLMIPDTFGHNAQPTTINKARPQIIQVPARAGHMFDDLAQSNKVVL